MSKKAILAGALVALVGTVGVVSTGYARDLTRDQAYCRQLVNEYEMDGQGLGFANPGLETAVAIDQCRSGSAAASISVLQQRLHDEGFEVPARS
jgi:hypothetical protein